ncbi:uncharacterized protein BO72DRAFT_479482 [Aspergillus fijiensis CBS 313.89]|uniref:Uncharacterized protein n=1 Tax=Aspergillus fijiensis CBS 313.89 TaxID=1448319 RepID=A0A8G1RPT6_9EURO|nr:uncharacterized protein BO72DRAFT_479482 [Aspergillus fijiensis CBS 313.89]RAK74436.1 hypothetical protein BO72DRAFT_479482 [Aspergillus fijiensis CBS 313.89]
MSRFVNSLTVDDRDDRDIPPTCIQIIDGNNPDINAGFGGKFVYIVVGHTSKPEFALTDIQILVQEDENKDYHDLAKGAGGAYRYIHTLQGTGAPIVDVKLLRRAEKVELSTVQALGYSHMTGDINAGRGGDYLHIIWKTA